MYKIGDKIVYPMHGAGIIEAIEEREIFEETKPYYIMQIVSEGLQILIPVDKVDDIGVRTIVNQSVIDEMIESLKLPMDVMEKNWNRRYREHLERLKTGDIFEVAKVVKNLILLDRLKGLSTGEKKMLNNARNFIVSEMVLIQDKDKEEILDLINSSVQSEA
ncbi:MULTISPECIES: CarD family transcriptional regulator [Acetobacterium]|jgi:CarD family transcriptional regulator|uniref:RNA polymerase-binding transcription factor CarD n=1 Tax=Acetobacterium wieringae TaxID=52694 RepID=A0A1F2PM27_9FIRM|nr:MULTISPECIES: CarD family transcriptional regulator [Acetobacterium]OFV72387.1 RNA polymerase-binding transcription factor CarD [Acetobacterium wieringae]URN84743.1 CarD family transcriptional regulator [Acetobacterium wieringae]